MCDRERPVHELAILDYAFSFFLPFAVLERPAESTAEPSPTYQTTGPFPDSAESRAVAGSTVKFLHQTQLPASEFTSSPRTVTQHFTRILPLTCYSSLVPTRARCPY